MHCYKKVEDSTFIKTIGIYLPFWYQSARNVDMTRFIRYQKRFPDLVPRSRFGTSHFLAIFFTILTIGGRTLDFYDIKVKTHKSNNRDVDMTVYPDFTYAQVKDLVCKGGSMYAFWTGNGWSTSMDDLIISTDKAIRAKVKELQEKYPDKKISGRYFNSNETRIMKDFDGYTKLATQSDIPFNSRIIFSNDEIRREDYATNQLNYTPTVGDTPAFDELLELLYEPEELEKILWFMGALLTNSMSKIQKFMYLYGGKGAGKGTVIKIFKMIFEGYYSTIDLMLLTSGSEFATSQIKEVPLLIDDDSDISRITKDTNLLKLTAHEPISVNAKYKQAYDVVFNGLLITASNQRFQVRNIDSGITRRAVVVMPTSYTHSSESYFRLMDKVKYELPHIAQKAIDLFNDKGSYYYEDYMDVAMAEATDYIFSFVRENANALGDEVTLRKASELFKIYLDDLGYETKGYKRRIKNELMRYYRNFYPQKKVGNEKISNVFSGLKRELIFPDEKKVTKDEVKTVDELLNGMHSTFDIIAKDYPAQYASESGVPKVAWDKCTTTLKDLDTTKLHYVRIPMNHIVIDFDMKNEQGDKDLEKNIEASRNFPETYMELSKSGKGVHLHYIYEGDVNNLAAIYEDDIEVKVFTGKQSLRRKLTKYNEVALTHISTGLPEKESEGIKMFNDVEIIQWNEKKLRTAIKNNLDRKYHANTKPSIDFIAHILEEAVNNGVKYDLRDMRSDVLIFATQSSNNAPYCMNKVKQMVFTTIDNEDDMRQLQSSTKVVPDNEIIFYDIEVLPNLFVLCFRNLDNTIREGHINPSQEVLERFVKYPTVGFNNRRYDNHIVYNASLGASVNELYHQSQSIINKTNNGFFSGAYELSYADIYEYASKKQSLKKWEIELGIKHDELELPWDQPVDESMFERVMEYCMNDIDATVEVFHATYADYKARLILSELSGLSVNATTTQQAAKFLFGDDKRPQEKFNYYDLSEEFPGYSHKFGVSEYRGEDPKEGGYVYSEPGVYENVALLDIASMHPTTAIVTNYFGPYTPRYNDLKQTRIYIKHRQYDKAREMFGGILKPYLEDEKSAKELSYALKIIINIVYGMTSAKFDNVFKHPKNIDNFIAKRGALFMIDLKHAVKERGYTVAHIKTDSIKIPNADQEIIDFVFSFGAKYGYDFEHEATYDKLALVNRAVYIAKDGDTWEPVGTMYREPYVFKKLFTGEDILEDDYMLTKEVKTAIYLGDTFIGKVANVYASKTGYEMTRKTKDDTRAAVTGTKGYLWRKSTDYQGKDDIDMSYYDMLALDGIKAIDECGDVTKIVRKEAIEEYMNDLLPF